MSRTRESPSGCVNARSVTVRNLEHQEQVKVFRWAAYNLGNYPELETLYAIPNGGKRDSRIGRNGKRYSPTANSMKAEGVKSGVSDIHLPIAHDGFIGLWIEMKVKPNRASAKQLHWIDLMNKNGHKAIICYSADDAIEKIVAYLESTRTKFGRL